MEIDGRRRDGNGTRVDDAEHRLRVEVDVDGEALDRPAPGHFDATAVDASCRRQPAIALLLDSEVAAGGALADRRRKVDDAAAPQCFDDLGVRLRDAVLDVELPAGDVGLDAGHVLPGRELSRGEVHGRLYGLRP